MKIVPFLTKVIIAPHGITDIGHSILTNNTKNLLKIYGFNFTLTNLITNINYIKSNSIMNILLIISSFYHFKHDIKNLKINNINISNYILFFIIFFSLLKPELLIYYMTLIHIPNHFKLNNFHIKKFKILNLFLYIGLILIFYSNNFNILDNIYILNNLISIIISHVIYQEKYILNKKC